MIFLTQTPLASSLYFPFDRIHFLRDTQAMAGASCLQQRALCLNKWSKGARCQTLPSDKHSRCSLTSPQAAGAYLRAALGLRMCCFGYFAIPVQKWIFSSLKKRSSVPHPSLLVNEAQWFYRQ